MEQLPTKSVTLKTVMRRKAFIVGFNQARYGIPMNYDVYCNDINERWAYERGRLFGHVYKGNVKCGAKVTYEAVIRYSEALDYKHII